MQASTGRTFTSLDEAISVGVPRHDLVEISGAPAAVVSIAAAVRNQRAVERARARNKAARSARRANRR